MQIDGKVVLITGASEGIGAACARAFGARGARLALVARSEEKLIASGGAGALAIPADLRDAEARRAAVGRVVEHFGRIDILINNAGIGLYAPSHIAPIRDVREMFELNFFAALDMIQHVTPHMRKQRSGAIVNVGSIAGKVTLPWFTLYSASKYALGSLSDGLRMELKADGIRVTQVCPGYVKTSFQSHVLAGTPPDRIARGKQFAGTAEECAAAIVKGVERNARTIVTPPTGWAFIALARLLPALVDWQLEKIYRGNVA